MAANDQYNLQNRIARIERAGLTPVYATPDGGVFYERPDGKFGFASEGMSTENPEQIARLTQMYKPGGTPHESPGLRLMQEDIVKEHPFETGALTAAEGLPFAGGWIDHMSPEAAAGTAAFEEVHPKTATGLQIGTGIVGSAGMGYGGLKVAEQVPSLVRLGQAVQSMPTAQKAMTLGTGGAIAGGTEGAISGYGRGGPQGAMEDAAWGGLGGGLGGALPPLLGAGWLNMKKAFGNAPAEALADQLGISLAAANVITHTFGQSGMDLRDALKAIKRGGEEGTIAEANEAGMALLDAVRAFGGEGSDVVSGAITGRVKREQARLGETMDKTLGESPMAGGVRADAQDLETAIARSTRGAREEAYNTAYSIPIDYSSPIGKEIENMFNMMPDHLKVAAMRQADSNMILSSLETGKPIERQWLFNVADDGTITKSELPNIQQLDQMKRAFGDVAFDQSKRGTPEASEALRWYRLIADKLKTASPAYEHAMRVAGDKISRDNALDLGMDILSRKVSARDFARMISGAEGIEKEYLKMGMRYAVDDVVGNVQQSLVNQDLDIDQLRTLLGRMSPQNVRDKVRIGLPGKEGADLLQALDNARLAMTIRAALAINSKTNIRGNIQDTISALTTGGLKEHVLKGEPLQATKTGLQIVTGETDKFAKQRQAEIYRDIAKALTGIKGRDARAAMVTLRKAMQGQAVQDAEWANMSDILMGKVAVPAMATGMATGQYKARED